MSAPWTMHGGTPAAAIIKRVREAVAAGEVVAVDQVLEVAKDRVPDDTGALQASGRVEVDPDTLHAVVAFGTTPETAEYAAIVHERMDLEHDDGQAKFLESALNETRADILPTVAREARRRL